MFAKYANLTADEALAESERLMDEHNATCPPVAEDDPDAWIDGSYTYDGADNDWMERRYGL